MKLLRKIFSFSATGIVTVLVFCGCAKDPLKLTDAFPDVVVLSVDSVAEDTAEITGFIKSHGASLVQYEGFCYLPGAKTPDILDNQIYKTSSDSIFKTRIFVKHDSTYSIKSFAANGFGYTISPVFTFTAWHKKRPFIPCKTSTVEKEVNADGKLLKIKFMASGAQYAGYGKWGVEGDIDVGSKYVKMNFNRVPTNGIFITNEDTTQFMNKKNPDEVYVEFNELGTRHPVISGSSVYVVQNKDNSITFYFCDLKYHLPSSTATLWGQFTNKN